MQKLNVNDCGHWSSVTDLTAIRTSSRTIIICSGCMAALEERLSDHVILRGIIKSTMSLGELAKIRRERAMMYARREVGGM